MREKKGSRIKKYESYVTSLSAVFKSGCYDEQNEDSELKCKQTNRSRAIERAKCAHTTVS